MARHVPAALVLEERAAELEARAAELLVEAHDLRNRAAVLLLGSPSSSFERSSDPPAAGGETPSAPSSRAADDVLTSLAPQADGSAPAYVHPREPTQRAERRVFASPFEADQADKE